LEQFAFDLADIDRIGLTVDPTLQDRAEHWLFWQMELGDDHLCAVCAGGGAPERPHLAPMRRWPLGRILPDNRSIKLRASL
jgi:hypothetical protein